MPSIYEKTLSLFEQSGFDASMSLSPDLKAANTHGVAKINGIQVIELIWPPPLSLDNDHLRDMTIWASDRRIFEMIRNYPFPKKSIGYVFMAAIKDSRPIAANYYDLTWIHLGYPEDLNKSFSKVDFSNV